MIAADAAVARYDLRQGLQMTLRRLKIISTVVPIAAVVLLELGRHIVIGPVPLTKRLLLDGFVVAGILLFSSIVFRYVQRMQEQLKRQNEELLALHSAGLAISAELSLDAVLKKVVDEARNLVGARYGAVSVVDEAGHIEQFVTSGVSAEQRAAIGPPPVGHGVLGVVLRQGQHLRLHDVREHPQSAGFPPHHPVMRTLLAVPIRCTGPFLGNIYLSEKNDGSDFTASDEETLLRFAVQAAIAIDNAHLHAQAADLAVAQERVRIAHEMHDGLAQVLGYVNTKVQAADAYMRRGKTDDASGQLRELALAAREAYSEVREGIVALRTLPDPKRSLGDVLRDYLAQWKEQTGTSTELLIDGEPHVRPAVELQLIRIVQEALTNVRKHAHATKVSVTLRRTDGMIDLRVADDGVGFSETSKPRTDFPRFGLSTMRERAESVGATLEVQSAPGGGTIVHLQLPIGNEG